MKGVSPRELAAALVALYDAVQSESGELPVDPVLNAHLAVVEKARAWLDSDGEEITNVVSAELPEYGGPRKVYVNGVFLVGVSRLSTEHVEGTISTVTLTFPAKLQGGA